MQVVRRSAAPTRIGPAMLDAGIGWGGSCFPKDVKALAYMAQENAVTPQVLNAVTKVNYDRRAAIVERVGEMIAGLQGKVVGLLGLAFKENTDDMRDAPATDISVDLIKAGAKVRGYDPVSMEVARPMLPHVELCKDPYEMAKGCDALIVVTEWNEFKQLDLGRIRELMRKPVLLDGQGRTLRRRLRL